MELFTIQCTTCRARLKVKDESAIGDILACPKCSSMVQVVPPVGWQRSTAAALLPVALAADSAISPAAITTPTALTTPAAALKPAAIVPPALPPRTSMAPASDPAVAHDSWASVALAMVRRHAFVLGSGLAGVLVGMGIYLLAVDSNPAAPVAVSHAEPTEATIAAHSDAPVSAAKVDAAPTTVVSSSPSEAAPPVTVDEKPNSAPANAASANVASATPLAATPEAKKTEPPVSEPKHPGTAGQLVEAAPPRSRPALRLEPLPGSVVPAAHPPVETENSESLSASPTAVDAAEQAVTTVGPMAADDAPVVTAVPALTRAEIDERMSHELPSVRFAKVSLAQFVTFISDFAAVPVTIDDASLDRVGKSRKTRVTVRLSNVTAQQALESAAASLGLSCAVTEGRLIVTARPQAAGDK